MSKTYYKIYKNENGNVGIGTTEPSSRLHVAEDNGVSILTLHREGSNPSTDTVIGQIKFDQDWNSNQENWGYIQLSTNTVSFRTDLDFYVKSTSGNLMQGMTIHGTTNNGPYVGIGTTSPVEILDVAGKQRITQNIVSNTTYPMLAFGSNRSINDYGGLNKDYWRINVVTPGANTTGEASAHAFGDLVFSGVAGSNTTYLDRFVIRAGGNVGIGTTNPTSLLHIDTGANSAANFRLGANRTVANAAVGQIIGDWNGTVVSKIAFKTGDDTINKDNGEIAFEVAAAGTTTEAMRINSTGNVGIGTDSPGSKLHVQLTNQSAYSASSSSTDHLQIRTQQNTGTSGAYSSLRMLASSNNGTNNAVGIINLVSPINGNNDSAFTFQLRDSSSVYGEKVRIQADGNVGIGTTNPTLGKLQVAGRGYFGPIGTGDATTKALMDTYSVLKLKPHDSNSTNMTFAQVNNGSGIGIQVTNSTQTADWDIALNPYGGNVGIGTTSPTAQLEISSSSASSLLNVKGAGGDSLLFVSGSGKVGIGTPSPDSLLHLSSASTSVLTIQNTTNAGNASLNFRDEGGTDQFKVFYDLPNNRAWNYVNGNGLTIYSTQTNAEIVRFGLGGANTYIDSLFNGNVGIGITSSAKLDVNGISRFRDELQIYSSTTDIGAIGNYNGALNIQGTSTRDVSLGSDSYPQAVFIEGTNGHVGIGNTSPTAKLHVDGNTLLDGDLTVTGQTIMLSASYVNITSSVVTIGDNILTLNAYSPFKRYAGLEMHDSGSSALAQFLWDSENNYFFISGSTATNSQNLLILGPDGKADLTAGALPVSYNGNEVSSSIVYQAGGNVGIGIANPSTTLDVAGTFKVSDWGHFSNSGGNEIVLGSSGANYGFIMNPSAGVWSLGYGSDRDTLGASVLSWSSSNLVTINNAYNLFLDGGNITLENSAGDNSATISNDGAAGSSKINVADSLYVIESGNVGIGTTSPTAQLEISSSSASSLLNIKGPGGDGMLYVSGSVFGRVGINTTSPSYNLHVTNPGPYESSIAITGNGANQDTWVIKSEDDSDGSAILNFRDDDSFTTALTLKQDGNVGIGTNSPTANLELAGFNATTGPVLRLSNYSPSIGAGGTHGTIEFYSGDTSAPGAQVVSSIKSIHVATSSNFGELAFSTNSNNEAVRIDLNGNVGIGTTSPGSKLTISDGDIKLQGSRSGDADIQSIIWHNTNSTGFDVAKIVGKTGTNIYEGIIRFETKDSGGTMAERMRIDSSGNVKIGLNGSGGGAIIRPAGQTSVYALEVDRSGTGSSVDIWDNNDDSVIIGATSSEQILTVKTGGNVGIGTTSPTAQLEISSSSASSLLNIKGSSGTGLLFVSGSGKVGIGTTDPAVQLNVYGTDAEFRLQRAGGSYTGIMYQGFPSGLPFIAGDNELAFGGAGTWVEHMRITSGGNVGIGTTSPTAQLEISSSSASSLLNVKGAGGTGLLFVSGSGNVGIGTASPDATLDVLRGTATGGTAQFRGTTYTTHINYSTNERTYIRAGKAGAYVTINDAHNGDVHLANGGGNVGIGTGSPSQKLHVVGTGYFSSNLLSVGLAAQTNSSYIRESSDQIRYLSRIQGRNINHNSQFIAGTTSGYSVYNNSGGSAVGISAVYYTNDTAISTSAVPNSTGYVLKISYTSGVGSTIPGYGGFYLATSNSEVINGDKQYKQKNRIVYRIWAKIPSGRNIAFASNAYGSNGFVTWLTTTAGNDDWYEYIAVQQIGFGGSFSSTAFFNISGGSDTSFDWYVAECSVIDVDCPADILYSPGLSIGYGGGTNYNSVQAGWGGLGVLNKAIIGGRVGIGTTSPNVKLEIHGSDITTSADTTAEPVLRLVRDVVDPNATLRKDSAVDFMLSRQQAVANNLPYTRLDIRLAGITDSSTPSVDVMSLLYDGNVGIGTSSPSSNLQIDNNNRGNYFGGKTVSINNTAFNDILSIELPDHRSAYIKIFMNGDWASHSSIAYVGEFMIQNGGNSYNEPGTIISEFDNTFNGNVITQILDSTNDTFKIQAKLSTTGNLSNINLTYHIMGSVTSIT